MSAFFSSCFGIAARPNVWLRFIGTDGKTYISITTDTGEKICGSPQFINDEYIVLMSYSIESKMTSNKNDETPDNKDDSYKKLKNSSTPSTDRRAIIIPQNTIKCIETVYTEDSEILKIDAEKSKHK